MSAPLPDSSRRRLWPRVLWTGAIAVVLCVALVASAHLYEERRWPFATASSTKAFLDLKFEMSVPEVRRALGLPLQSCENPPKNRPDGRRPPHYNVFDCVFSDDKDPIDPEYARFSDMRFAEGLHVFGGRAQLAMRFWDGRLDSVTVFLPYDYYYEADRETALRKVREALERSYGPLQEARDEKHPKNITLKGSRGPVTATLDIVVEGEDAPQLRLDLSYGELQKRFDEERSARDATAL